MNRPRGTRDFAPDEMAARRAAEHTMRDVFHRFNYREVATPTFEELELFTAKSGEGIKSELYDFADKGDREMTLRPELTAPVMRMYFADHQFDPKPIKWFYHGSCFRYDRPQTGRYREFWQFGCEQIGAGTPLAMAELIALACNLLDAVGLQHREVRVGHVGILGSLVDAIGLDAEARAALMRGIDKGDDGAFTAAAEAGGDEAAIKALQTALQDNDLDAMQDDAATELQAVADHLKDLGVDDASINLGIARGLDYYTGVVFEIHAPALEAQSQLVGGGAYDLSGVFGAQAVPTIGFGLGFDRTLVALDAEGAAPADVAGPHVYLGALSEAAVGVVARGATKMRNLGLRVDMDLVGRKPGQIAKAADATGARYLVLVGDRDLESGDVKVKHLVDGTATQIGISDFVDWLLEQSGHVDFRDYN